MMEAAEKLHGLKTHVDVGKLIGQYDQMLTNWKARGIPSKEVLNIAKALGCNPYWLRDGAGDMVPTGHKAAQPDARYVVPDPILDDLNSLETEDAEAWRARIRAAAVRARKEKQEKSDRRTATGLGDPPSESRRTA